MLKYPCSRLVTPLKLSHTDDTGLLHLPLDLAIIITLFGYSEVVETVKLTDTIIIHELLR